MFRRLWLPASLCLLGGCPTTTTDPDASVTIDVPASGQLRVAWLARPDPIPGPSSSNATIERAVFRTRDLRLIGDVTPAPLPRLALDWAGGVSPAQSAFPDAQLGTYSRLLFSLDPGSDGFAYEISGQVEVEGVRFPYVIRDPQPASIALEFVVTLAPGGTAVIPVRVEIDTLINRVDFQKVTPIDGQLIVDAASSQLAAVRDELDDAFGVHDDD